MPAFKRFTSSSTCQSVWARSRNALDAYVDHLENRTTPALQEMFNTMAASALKKAGIVDGATQQPASTSATGVLLPGAPAVTVPPVGSASGSTAAAPPNSSLSPLSSVGGSQLILGATPPSSMAASSTQPQSRPSQQWKLGMRPLMMKTAPISMFRKIALAPKDAFKKCASDGKYQVSYAGEVRRVTKDGEDKAKPLTKFEHHGRTHVRLGDKSVRVDLLVAEAWLQGHKYDGKRYKVFHRDGNRANNTIYNIVVTTDGHAADMKSRSFPKLR